MSRSFLADSISLFSQINMVKGGYFYSIIDTESKNNSIVSEVYTVYGECVAAMQIHLLGEQIRRSPAPELIIDLTNFGVIQINYKARRLLSAPSDWKPFKIFPDTQASEILNKVLSEKITPELREIQRYDKNILSAYCYFKVVSCSNNRLFLKLSFGCPVLNVLQDAKELFF